MTEDFRTGMVELLPRLRRFALLLCGDLDRAEDLTQETCLKALANSGQWTAGTRLDSWMYKIAQNIWYDRLRASKSRGITVDIDDALDVIGEDGRRVGESRLMLGHVARHIGQLPSEQQLLIALVCADGLTYREAADALDLPIGTVMSRLARARKALHEAIGGSVADGSAAIGSKHT